MRHLLSSSVVVLLSFMAMSDTLRGMVRVLANADKVEVQGIAVEAVAAYNMTVGKEKFHPKGRDNGYVLLLGGKKVYVAGGTEDTKAAFGHLKRLAGDGVAIRAREWYPER